MSPDLGDLMAITSVSLTVILALVAGAWKVSAVWTRAMDRLSRLEERVNMVISLVVKDAEHRQLLQGNIVRSSAPTPSGQFKAKMDGQHDVEVARLLVDLAEELTDKEAEDDVLLSGLLWEKIGIDKIEERCRVIGVSPTEYLVIAMARIHELKQERTKPEVD